MDIRKQQLRAFMTDVLKEVQPRLKEDIYQDFVQKLVDQAISMFENFLNVSKKDTEQAERIYDKRQLKLFAEFLIAIPGATTNSKKIKDFVEAHMTRAFVLAELELSDTSRRILLDAFDRAFAAYCGFSKIGYKEFGERIYESHEDRVIANIKSGLIRSRNTQAQNRLKQYIESTLEIAGLGLEDYQKRNVQDQMLWLFSDYLQSPEEEQDDVYELGEERILFSLFDPTRYGEGSTGLII
ncbi:MAG TPA: hypothetical protein VJ842_06540 [Pyrinomonadaceae bacterium]|nr:hypothetical protein [Pyrinomonadaceae bacterium]